jgi:hypothetical protein
MTHLELRERICPDGIRNPNVPMATSDVNREVKDIVEPAYMDGETRVPGTRSSLTNLYTRQA